MRRQRRAERAAAQLDAPCYPVSEQASRAGCWRTDRVCASRSASSPRWRPRCRWTSRSPRWGRSPPVSCWLRTARSTTCPSTERSARGGHCARTCARCPTTSVGLARARAAPPGACPTWLREPERQFTSNRIPFPTRVGFNSRLDGPAPGDLHRRQDQARGLPPPATHRVPEDFGVNWEGPLPGTERDGRAHRARWRRASSTLTDPGADFCRAGVEEGDILALLGCEQDADCDPRPAGPGRCATAPRRAPRGSVCRADFVADEERLRLCRPELSSRRRYEVREVFRSRLTVRPSGSTRCRSRSSTPARTTSVCQPDAAHQRGRHRRGPGLPVPDTTAAGEPAASRPAAQRAQDGSWTAQRSALPGRTRLRRCGRAGPGPAVRGGAPAPARVPAAPALLPGAGRARPILLSSSALPYLASRLEEPSAIPGAAAACPTRPAIPCYGQRIPLSAPHCKGIVDGPDAIADRGQDAHAGGRDGRLGQSLPVPAARTQTPAAGRSTSRRCSRTRHVRFVLTNLEQYVGDAANVFVTIEGGFSPTAGAAHPPVGRLPAGHPDRDRAHGLDRRPGPRRPRDRRLLTSSSWTRAAHPPPSAGGRSCG